MKVLFVCTGNTCRSPIAEGIFKRYVSNDNLEDRIFVQSAGLSVVEGTPAAEYAVKTCAEAGIDISGHRSRKLIPEDTIMWDLYFSMTETHAYILEKAGIPSTKIYRPDNIPDPYGQGPDVYRAVREKLEKEVRLFYNKEVKRLLIFESQNKY